ncbi:MAG: acetate--CoA ligase family protein [Gammaproteobacteria bacterium]
MRLQRLLNPRSIAFVGGRECAVAIERTRALGFDGEIFAVNPKRAELAGIKTVASVDDIAGSPDAAFIALPRDATPEVVRALRARNAGGAVIYAAGFAETGARDLQKSLLAVAAGMPLLGPNCYGFINALSRVALWPDEHGLAPIERGVVIVTQSGNIGCNITMLQRGLPLAALLTLGNQADVDVAGAVADLALDPRITAIGLHIEGLRDAAAFAAAAAIARKYEKPVVVLKTGRSPQGARITLSHTASLAGADRLCDALFERYGVARVTTLSSLVETLKLLHLGGPLKGRRLLSLSCSGGEAALIADLAPEHGLYFPPFIAETASRVAATLNDLVTIDNPLDYHTFIWGQHDKLAATFGAALSGGFDAGLLILDTPTHPAMKPDSWTLTARAFIEAQRQTGARAAVIASLPEGMPPALAEELSSAGIAPLIGIDDALQALAAAALIGEQQALGSDSPEFLGIKDLGIKDIGVHEVETLRERAAKVLLATHGLEIPPSAECTIDEAAVVAERLGFPVAVKIANDTIAHKSDVGGVALSLRTAAEVRDAACRMAKLGDRVLVERMIEDAAAELIVGVVRDSQFGLALLVGAGGILAELMTDTVTMLLPTSRAEIERGVRRLKVWRLVEGFRGRKADEQALLRAIEAIAAFAHAHRDRLEELDVNPLLALPDRAVAVDALIKLRKSPTDPPP